MVRFLFPFIHLLHCSLGFISFTFPEFAFNLFFVLFLSQKKRNIFHCHWFHRRKFWLNMDKLEQFFSQQHIKLTYIFFNLFLFFSWIMKSSVTRLTFFLYLTKKIPQSLSCFQMPCLSVTSHRIELLTFTVTDRTTLHYHSDNYSFLI